MLQACRTVAHDDVVSVGKYYKLIVRLLDRATHRQFQSPAETLPRLAQTQQVKLKPVLMARTLQSRQITLPMRGNTDHQRHLVIERDRCKL